ncbi:hypothetical protein FPQ18DRAFT_401416 [Pyronema domesticum]|uniref:Similar to Tetratricopeptide repeat protein 36 homolog acc. no. A7RL75 n=1 Tax=Pyronema omphalodes (strain CBS 100304) TaxID=1076935 RepID=U4LI12_PYROM|nr:hypothetical protein FPQ18DRAFT_401416 [Pyronema domesticum]CCX31759.1 Similar to Tetratricopeptide repeat protein 36 homolog; acc. no. A7RL75 [Pyronema omphalodes CBS 100304]
MSSATILPTGAPSLSTRDATTLTVLFDSESATALHPTIPINPSLPSNPQYPSSILSHIKSLEHSAIEISLTNPSLALEPFNTLLVAYPLYASGYNNRAQLKRILKHPSADIKRDLQLAIKIATGTIVDNEISKCMQKVLQNAWSQMGIVFMAENDTEKAVQAWMEGAKYESTWCRRMAARHNPVARLCGMIVKDAMRREMGQGEERRVEVRDNDGRAELNVQCGYTLVSLS